MRRNEPLTARISRRTFAKGTVAAVVGLGLSTGSAAAAEESADLVTGPDEEPIGSVSVTEENGSLTVTYALTDETYEITETHLHVADDAGDIPTNKPGNPKVGHFEHSSEHEEGAASVVHVIDVSELGDELVVAAQAKVRTEVEEEEEGADDGEASDEEEAADDSDEDEAEIEAPEEDAEEEETDDAEDEEPVEELEEGETGDEDEPEGEESEEEAGDEEEEPEYEYADAWAAGERINDRTHPRHGHYLGSWATYVAYQRAADEPTE